jgi:hypothetical protein
MAQRERKKNPCKHCGYPFDFHASALHNKSHGCPGYVESRIFRASPSSVKSAGQCWRKWASRALGGISVETEAKKFGDNLHAIAEAFLLTRKTPDQTTKEGRLFNEGIPFLPKRVLRPEEVEGEVSFTFDGVPWIGYYDWKLFAEREIGDHKTSADPKKYGLTSPELPKDLQACTYAYDSGWPEANLRWLYYSKKSKNAYPVDAKVSRQQATDVIGKYSPIAQQMQKYFNANPVKLTIAQINEIENDPNACDYVGRMCDFSEHCQIVRPASLVRKKESSMDPKIAELKAKIAAKKAGGTPAVNPPEVTEALKETEKEVASTAPAAEPEKPIQTTVAPQADTPKAEPKTRGRRARAADEGEHKSIEGLVEHLSVFRDLLPAGVKITIELTPAA